VGAGAGVGMVIGGVGYTAGLVRTGEVRVMGIEGGGCTYACSRSGLGAIGPGKPAV
jgi:hypothetical protein